MTLNAHRQKRQKKTHNTQCRRITVTVIHMVVHHAQVKVFTYEALSRPHTSAHTNSQIESAITYFHRHALNMRVAHKTYIAKI